MVKASDIKDFLDEKAFLYNQPSFIKTDPIQIPRQFSEKENMEIAGFLAATIAWGQRTTIIKNARRLIQIMDNQPFHFIMNATENELSVFDDFKHRTFNGDDCKYFIRSLKNIYMNYDGLQAVFEKGFKTGGTVKDALIHFYGVFFEIEGIRRTR
ncbi:MAG: DUF2400 family protein, partial [Prolixibacteraceae bacterium]|nr:DUF2400 family protein [Prolixibacteraceae bacterium]